MAGPIIMTEEYWKYSQLSFARHTGRINLNGKTYSVVNKEGITVFELSDPTSPHYVIGDKVIQPGEPCHLVRLDWIPVYRALGREKTIELVKNNISLDEALVKIKQKHKT